MMRLALEYGLFKVLSDGSHEHPDHGAQRLCLRTGLSLTYTCLHTHAHTHSHTLQVHHILSSPHLVLSYLLSVFSFPQASVLYARIKATTSALHGSTRSIIPTLICTHKRIMPTRIRIQRVSAMSKRVARSCLHVYAHTGAIMPAYICTPLVYMFISMIMSTCARKH